MPPMRGTKKEDPAATSASSPEVFVAAALGSKDDDKVGKKGGGENFASGEVTVGDNGTAAASRQGGNAEFATAVLLPPTTTTTAATTAGGGGGSGSSGSVENHQQDEAEGGEIIVRAKEVTDDNDVLEQVRNEAAREATPATEIVTVQQPNKDSSRSSGVAVVVSGIVCIVVVVAVVVAAVVLSTRPMESTASSVATTATTPASDTTTEECSSTNTAGTSLNTDCKSIETEDPIEYLKGTLYPLLSEEDDLTVQAIETQGSPQASAFEHLSNDPNLFCYEPFRLVQRYALTAFYHSTNGGKWFNNNGWLDYEVDECDWFGKKWICCDLETFETDVGTCDQNGVFKHLLLDRNNLSGEVPLDIRHLTGLETMFLMFNDIEILPLETIINIDNFRQLHAFNNSLHNLNFDVDLPPDDFAKPDRPLEVLNLGSCGITGSFPECFSSLRSLRELIVEMNEGLTGPIPESYCEIEDFFFLSIFETGVTGEVPDCLCDKANQGTFFIEAIDVNDFVCDCCFG